MTINITGQLLPPPGGDMVLNIRARFPVMTRVPTLDNATQVDFPALWINQGQSLRIWCTADGRVMYTVERVENG